MLQGNDETDMDKRLIIFKAIVNEIKSDSKYLFYENDIEESFDLKVSRQMPKHTQCDLNMTHTHMTY